MRPYPAMRQIIRSALRPWALGLVVAVLIAGSAPSVSAATGDEAAIQSTLDIVLEPAKSRLDGTAVIALPAAATAVFRLSVGAVVSRVTLNDRPAAYRFEDGRLTVTDKPPLLPGGSLARITIDYAAVFDDPVPVMPLNTDNPGYGVSAAIGADGVFLMGGAGWYPVLDTSHPQIIHLTVTGPEGLLAVTAGRRIGHLTDGGRTRSQWEITAPVGPISLSAAHYQIAEGRTGAVALYAYLLPQSAHLAETYLAASRRFIELYQNRFGPYPFEKFAVVENFFPTGYGFPSWTLMGTRVLNLPFIPSTSLGHEIAHCWWGNGVFVAPDSGNWSEGLTTYVAEHLYKELVDGAEARDYRREWLRNYAALVPPEADFPLSRFHRRTDNISKVIGYDKGAMVFHMLREQVGETHFWNGLRRFYAEMRFRPASWDDIRHIFAHESGQDLDGFFDQWVNRSGAPTFAFGAVTVRPEGGAYRVDGSILQSRPAYGLTMEMTILTEGGERIQRSMAVAGAETPFHAVTAQIPGKIVMDPGVDVFRRLVWAEVPPTVNTVKASGDLLVVVAARWRTAAAKIIGTLLTSLGVAAGEVIEETRIGEVGLAGKDVLFLGVPSQKHLISVLPETITLAKDGFTVEGESFDQSGDAMFCVFQHPVTEGKIAALFFPLSKAAADAALPKITHYGKYSTLVFENGVNRIKTTWPVDFSPMVYYFPVSGDQ